MGVLAEHPTDFEHTSPCALHPKFGDGGRALMERGCLWIPMAAHSELWLSRCFSQHPSVVHSSLGLLSSFPREGARSLFSVGSRSYMRSRILQALPCHNGTSSGHNSAKGVLCSSIKAPQEPYFPTDIPPQV